MSNETSNAVRLDCPAFPQVDTEYDSDNHRYNGRVYSEGGMTLRDYFAAKALAGMLRKGSIPPELRKTGLTERGWVSAAYKVADAMLNERAKLTAHEQQAK